MRGKCLFTILAVWSSACALAESGDVLVKGFQSYGGSWHVEGGILFCGADAGAKLIFDSPPIGDGEVGVEVMLPGRRGGNAGLIVRTSDADVGADRFNGCEISLDASGTLRLGATARISS